MRKKLIFVLTISVGLLIFSGCSNKNTSSDISTTTVTDVSNPKDDDSYSENFSEDTIPEETTEYCLEFMNAREFSDGFAWAKAQNDWCIINTEGKITGRIPGQCEIISDFKGGYAVIAPSKDTNPHSNKIIISDTMGNAACTFEDYDEVVDYQALEYGIVIVKRTEDTFDRSGTFYYNLNIKTKELKELPWYEGYYRTEQIGLDEYFENGYYSCLDDGNRNTILNAMQFYNALTNELYSLENDEAIQQLNEGNNSGWEAFTKSGKRFIEKFYNTWAHSAGTVKIMFNELGVKSIGYPEYHVVEEKDDCVIMEYGSDSSRYNVLGEKDAEAEDAYYLYNLNKDTVEFINPNVSYFWKYFDYSEGRFAIYTWNNVRSFYVTVLDEDMNPIFTPIKVDDYDDYEYGYITHFMTKNYIYIRNTEDKLVTVVNLNSGETEAEYEESKILSVDEENDIIWLVVDSNIVCYDALTNKQLPLPDGSPIGGFHNNYVCLKVIISDEDGNSWTRYKFYDRNGVELVINI